MADIAVAAVIRQATQITGNFIVEEGSRLYWLKEDTRWIEREMRHIQSYLKAAERKKNEDEQVANLLNDIRELAQDTQAMLSKIRLWTDSEDKKGFLDYLKSATCFCCNCYTAHDFAMGIEKIKRRVAEIERVRKTYGINEKEDDTEIVKIKAIFEDISRVQRTLSNSDGGVSSAGRTVDPRQPIMLHVDEPYVPVLDNELETLKAKLLNPKLPTEVASIVGMGGVGKTTLAKKVFKSVRQYYDRSAMVSVSQHPKIKQILEDIARQVRLEENEMTGNLEANLYSFLMEKKYLLLIDDIWNVETWNALKVGIPITSENGSRIIVTSRDSGVGRYIGGEESLHGMKPLDFDKSWILFSKMIMAPSEDNVPSDLEDIGIQIVEKCGGLPLAIIVIVGVLREKERLAYAWEGVLKCMGQEEDQCLRILALSYHDLPDSLKSCFLYLGIFPDDYEYSAFKLIKLWVAEGFIQAGKGQMVEDIGWECLNKLVARNLIQVVDRNFDGRIETFRIHDLLYRLCFLVGTGSLFFNTLQDVASISGEVCRVTAYHGRISEYWSLNIDTPKLSTFFWFNSDQKIYIEDLGKLCESFKFLVVLVVEFWTFCSSEIPNEIGNLIHLTHLQFTDVRILHGKRRFFQVAQLPTTITNLKKLLTLDVQGCRYVEVPDSIWKMEQLRHLIASELRIYSDPSIEISEPSVPHLQTLRVIFARNLNPQYLYKFTDLRRLGIDGSDEPCCMQMIEVLSDASAPVLPKLESLELHRFGELSNLDLSHFENLREVIILYSNIRKLPIFPANLARLGLFGTHLDNDPQENLGALPKLKFLQLIEAYSGGINRTSASAGSFPQLQVLEIICSYFFNSLREIVVDDGAMPMLKELIISPDIRTNIPDRLRRVMTIVDPGFHKPIFKISDYLVI